MDWQLAETDEQRLAEIKEAAKVYQTPAACRKVLREVQDYPYLERREGVLRHHGFVAGEDDYLPPELRYYAEAYPPSRLELAALRHFQAQGEPDALRQAVTWVEGLLPDFEPDLKAAREAGGW